MGCNCNKPKYLRIVEGWKNVIWPDPQIEVIAKERSEICDKCSKVKWVCGVALCSLCGCPLTAKCRSLSEKCGLDKWSSVNLKTNV